MADPLVELFNGWLPEAREQLSAFAVIVGVPLGLFQLHQARQLDRGRNTIELLKHLNGSDLMKARYAMSSIDLAKPFADFTTEERVACSDVCASFALAGTLARKRLVDLSAVIDTWGPSIRKNHERLREFIAGRRAAYGPGAKKFWTDFDWLAARAGAVGGD